MPELIRKPLNKELNALNTLEIQRFASLQKELLTAIRAKVGKKTLWKEIDIVKDRMSYCGEKIDKGDVNLRELINLMKDMVHLLDSASVFPKANAKGEKWEKANPVPDITDPNIQEEQPSVQETTSSEQTPPISEQVLPVSTALVVHASREKDSKEKTTSSEYSPTPHRDENKGKGIATEDDPVKLLMHLIEQGGSDPKMLNLQQFSTFGRQMTIEEAKAQLEEMKRLAVLKAKKEKSEKKLKKVMTLAEYEAKRAKMLVEYNHYITYRADKIPITKINNKIDKVSKHATMIIERNNQPLSLTVYEKFVLKKLGFGEWIKVHTMASKNKSKANDILLKNLKAKFECIKTQARKLGIPPPPELIAFGFSVAEKKRKSSSEIIKEVFIKDDIVMDEMHMNLIPPPMVEGSRGLVIREPESGIFFDNGNFDLLFQREEEFHLAITS
ncbi:hypothetical protein Tco_1177702 [Tanacetum coccineum]